MSARIISGLEVAVTIRKELKERVDALKKLGVQPGLGVVLVGEDPASVSYVAGKAKGAAELGIYGSTVTLPADTTERELLATVDQLNQDKKLHGILVQLPLPPHLNEERVIIRISPEKDADGSHPMNFGRLLRGEPCPVPCTPKGIQELLVRTGNSPDGKHVVICGRSNLVGKPLAALLLQKKSGSNATVTMCHTGTVDMGNYTRQADIIVAAMGRPGTITANMVRDGAVVIDVGVSRIEDKSREKGYRLVGDVDFEAVKAKASAITPVPGGVGPMTVTMLLQNTIDAAARSVGLVV
jgi:methylenetetrahydrofolate dehydrogenase (NADP+)/methenyltetrahydrofolate cyclohydrolase